MVTAHPTRRDRLLAGRSHDAYRRKGKLSESTQCGSCGACYHNGRWTWMRPTSVTRSGTCPACQRIAGQLPAGRIDIEGGYVDEHRTDILNLINNTERSEKEQRPLERVMQVAPSERHVVVTTTGVHVARAIGEAMARSHSGELSVRYADHEMGVRVYWHRED